MYRLLINGIEIDNAVDTFETIRTRAHIYFLELIKHGYIRTINGIIHGEEIEIVPVDYN